MKTEDEKEIEVNRSGFLQVADENDNFPLPPESTLTTSEAKTKEEKSEAQQHAEFLANDENKKGAVSLAAQAQQIMGDKWFTIDQLLRKTGESRVTAIQKLQMCMMFGHARQRMGGASDGREKAGQPLFKIAISKEMRIRALDEIIQYHKEQIVEFELQRKMLA